MHASLMLVGGVHLKVVSERLGHANISLTADTYSHLQPVFKSKQPLRLIVYCQPPYILMISSLYVHRIFTYLSRHMCHNPWRDGKYLR